MVRGSLRSVRHAPLEVETLEPRLLMAGDITWLILSQLPDPPAQVITSQPATPVNLHFPGGDSTLPAVAWSPGDPEPSGDLSPGGIDLYRVSVGPGTEILQLNDSEEMLPQGDSVQLLVFDSLGDLLTDATQNAASESTTVALTLGGPVTSPADLLYVAVRIAGPAGSSSDAPDIAYQIQMTPETNLTLSALDAVTAVFVYDGVVFYDSFMSIDVPLDSTAQADLIGTPVNPQGTGVQTGAVSSGSGLPTATQHGVSTQSPSPPPALSAGTDRITPATFDGRDAQSSASPSTPIDVGPLPTSQYEPAAGIFSVGAPIEWVDPVEATRVVMSLVRLTTGRQGSPHDDQSSEQGLGIRDSVLRDTAKERSGHVDVTVVRLPSDDPGHLRPGRLPSSVAASGAPRSEVGTANQWSFDSHTGISLPLVSDGPVWGRLWVTAATLPPIDEYDRPNVAAPSNRRSDETTDEKSQGRVSGRAEAIFLGLSGSAALGVSLYAPDLTAAVRRAVRSRVTNPRPRPAKSREDRAPR
jgi:hypothetical protein